jgi:hypothetical protein
MSEEVEIETTDYFNIRFNCPASELCCATTNASPSSDTATTPTGATPHTVTSTPPTLSKAGPVSCSRATTADNGAQGLS